MASAYRIVFESAVMVISGVIPIALFAKERKTIYRRKGENLREVVVREEIQRTLILPAQNREARSPDCLFYNGVADDAEHTFFSCERWDVFRQELYADTGDLSPDNIVREMLNSAGSWNRVAHYIRTLLIAKKIELDRRPIN